MIHLIGKGGAATTDDEGIATAIERIAGYHRCTKEEYAEYLREIGAVDLSPTGTTITVKVEKETRAH